MRLRLLPAAGQNLPCQVKIRQDAKGEVWQRRFAQSPMQSRQRWRNGALWEQMGPLALQLHSQVSQGQLLQSSQTARCFGLPLPLQVTAREWAISNVMHFDVEIGFKKGSMILHYSGALRPVAEV